MAQTSKAHLIHQIHTILKKRFKPKRERGDSRLSVLEAVIHGICHEGTTREQANQALSRFKDGFFDWNEVRVSSLDEIQGALAGLPDPENRAYRIRKFLRQLFEKTYGFTLDALTKKPLKESLKVLSEYEAFSSDYVEATVTQLALGGHAIPLDGPARRALERLHIAEPTTEHASLRSLLERAVPKNRGTEFVDLIEDLAHDTCVQNEPDCPRCDLRKMCPTGIARKQEALLAAKQAAATARAAAKRKESARKPVKVSSKSSAAPPRSTATAKPKPKSAGKASKAAKGRAGGHK
jgi:endonuclease-3